MALTRANFMKSTRSAPKSKAKAAKAPVGPNKGKKARPEPKDTDADGMASGGAVRGQKGQSRNVPCRKFG